VLDVFWHHGRLEVSGNPDAPHLIGIFEARSQYPVYRGGQLSLETYVRAPKLTGNETPEALDPETMAEGIQRSLDESGRFLVVELQRWRRAREFHSPAGSRADAGAGDGARWASVRGIPSRTE